MFKRVATITLFVLLTASYALAGSITDEVKKTVDEVVRIVTDKGLKNKESERRKELKKAISTIFDYREMAKRSLGRHWNEHTPAEKNQFVSLFADLLENSYAGKIESYNNEKITYVNESTDDGYSEVRSKILTPTHDEYSIDYQLINENGKWMVYDIDIEGVSLVSNYRTQFNKIISEQGYGELVKKLRMKSEELKIK